MAQYVLTALVPPKWKNASDPANVPQSLIAEIITPPSESALITEIGISGPNPSGVTFDMSIGRSSSTGTAAYYHPPAIAYNPNSPSSLVNIVTQWTTVPGVPANFLRRMQYPTTGTSSIWIQKMPNGILVPPSSSLLIYLNTSDGGQEFPISFFIGGLYVEYDS